MANVMSFDIATHVGVAYGAVGGSPKSTTFDLGQGRSQEARFAKAIQVTERLVSKFDPDYVVYEAPIGGKHANFLLIGLAACVVGQVVRMNRPIKKLNILTVRKHFLGRHVTVRDFPHLKKPAAKAAIKGLVIDRCRLLKWEVKTDDAADACALWDYACATEFNAQAAPLGSLFNG